MGRTGRFDDGEAGVTHAQLEAATTSLRADMHGLRAEVQRGIEGIYARMDETNSYLRELNGRTRKVEDSAARHDERLKTLFSWKHRNQNEGRRVDDGRWVTRRDVQMFVAGCTLVVAIFAFIYKGLPAIKVLLGP